MVRRLGGEESSLSRLREVLTTAGTAPVSSLRCQPDFEKDIFEVTRRLERLQSEYPNVGAVVELNVNLVKAREQLASGCRHDLKRT